MNDHIYERVLEIAKYVADTKATVRAAAEHFSVSKRTVHKDLTGRLKSVHTGLYEEVAEVLKFNQTTRHLRGGDATRTNTSAVTCKRAGENACLVELNPLTDAVLAHGAGQAYKGVFMCGLGAKTSALTWEHQRYWFMCVERA